MATKKHQYRVVMIIQDDLHPEKDLGRNVSFPSHPSLVKVFREFERMQHILEKHAIGVIDLPKEI